MNDSIADATITRCVYRESCKEECRRRLFVLNRFWKLNFFVKGHAAMFAGNLNGLLGYRDVVYFNLDIGFYVSFNFSVLWNGWSFCFNIYSLIFKLYQTHFISDLFTVPLINYFSFRMVSQSLKFIDLIKGLPNLSYSIFLNFKFKSLLTQR